MLRKFVSRFLILSVFFITLRADDVVLEQDLPILFNHTKELIALVCSELFLDEHSDTVCQNNFLSPERNIASPPPVLTIKCESEKKITFMTTPSEDRQLAVLVPNVQDADTYDLHYAIVEDDPIGNVLRPAKSDHTFWTTTLNADGSPSLWLRGPKVGPWKPPPQKIYEIKTEILPREFKNETRVISVEFTWNETDEFDSCFHVFNTCNNKILGDSFDRSIEPNDNRSVVVDGIPLGDTCTFLLYGMYGITNVTYRTPECYEIEGCIPLPELFSNVSMDILEADSLGWTVRVRWGRPRETPIFYNMTLYGDDVYTIVLPGNATEVLFEDITDEGFFNVTLVSVTSNGKAYARRQGFLPPLDTQSMTVGLLVGAVSLSALVFITVTSSVVYCKQRRSEKLKFDYLQQPLPKKLSKDTRLPLIRELTAKDRWEVEGSRLMLHEVVGEGAFGVVRRGTLAPSREVAVKMLKDFPSAEEVRSFHAEMELMKSVGAHPHVVSLLGCCSGRRPLIIAEYCSLGDLLTYLRCCWGVMLSKRNAKYYNNNKDEMESYKNENKCNDEGAAKAVGNKLYDIQGVCDELTFADLLSYCRQIAMGMEFFASNRMVHRDLAARNVLVTGDKTLKIADFGLSRDVYQENQYRQKGNGKMPVKWMALESLTHRIFTTQSDVWSFGVVMWEVVTVGGAPYPAVAPSRLPRLLRAGYRMPCPRNCTPELYEVMTWCWRARPCERPTFAQLRARFDELLTAACADRYLALDLPADLPTPPALPSPPSSPIPTTTPYNDKNVWELAKSYARPNAQSNHYTSTPVTQTS